MGNKKVQKEVLKLSKKFTAGLKKKVIRFDGIVLEDVLFNVGRVFDDISKSMAISAECAWNHAKMD